MFDLVPIVAIVCTFSFPVLLLWVILEIRRANLRSKERMALITQGIIPPEGVKAKQKANPNRFISLRNGVILIGIAAGILVGFSISEGLALAEEKAFWIYSSSILLFLGIAYLIYFFVTRNMKMPKDDEDDFSQE